MKEQYRIAFLANSLLLSRKRLQKYEEKTNQQNYISKVQNNNYLILSLMPNTLIGGVAATALDSGGGFGCCGEINSIAPILL